MSSYFRDEYTSLIDREEDLLNYINKFLTPSEREKKQKGEVFTPLSLVKEMLDKLPKEVWYNPNLKWADIANGMGNFPIIIYRRLMETLVKDFPDKEERKRHILENMLYVADLSIKNCFMFRNLVDPNGVYKLNIFCGNSLSKEFEQHIKNVWKVDKFDIIVGNPPYQPTSNNKKGGKSLWNIFVEKVLNKYLIKNGYLAFIHPALWRKPDNKLKKEMFSKQIHYLRIYNDTQGNKIFRRRASTRVDFYILQNIKSYKNTRIHFEDDKIFNIKIDKLPFIPNFGWSIFSKVLQKLNNNGIMVNGDSDCHTTRKHVSIKETNAHKYKLLNSISKTKGKTFRYSSKFHKNQYHKKVLFSNGRHIVPFYDDGELGYTQGGLYILVNDETKGNKIVNYLNSKLLKYIMKATKWSNFETCKQLFWYIPDITNIISNVNNESIYKYFNLSADEIELIEEKKKDNDNEELSKNVDEEKTDNDNEELSKNVDEEKTDSNNSNNNDNNSNSLYTKKELKKKKYTLSKLQDIAKGLNIPTQIPKTGKKKGMKNKSKADLINDILNCD
jgi:hypothetical protein